MSTPACVERDERTVAVENLSYRWVYSLLAYMLLADVMYRSMVYHEAAWDLMAMVILGGAVCTIYQAHQKVLTHGWVMKAILVACIAGVIAAVLAMSL